MTWANQVRMLKENMKALGIVLGRGLINALKPFVSGMNVALQAVTKFATNVLNALGKIFGWQVEMETSGISADFASIGDDLGIASDAADNLGSGAGDAANNLGKAAKAAKELKTITLGIDELNLNQPDTSESGSGGSGGSGGGGGGGSGSGGGGSNASGGDVSFNVKETAKFYESMIDNLFDLGAYVGDTLVNSLNSINWDTIRSKARAFGTGLAEFFNGFFSTDAMGALGETVAEGLNTALEGLYGFATTFKWGEFGGKVREFIDKIFDKFDWQLAGKTIDAWVQGIADAIWGFLTNTDNQGKIIQGIGQVIFELDGKTIALLIIGFTVKSALASGVLAKAVKVALFGTGGAAAAAGAVAGAGEVTAEATVTGATVAEGSGLLAQGGLVGALKAWAAPLLANPFTVSAGGLIGLGYVMYKAKQYFVDGKEASSSFEKSIFDWFQGKIDKVKERLKKGEGDEGLEYNPNAYINPNYIIEDSAQDTGVGKQLQEWFSNQTSRLKLAYKGKFVTAVETIKEWINNIKSSWDENTKDGVGVNAKLRTGPIDIKGWWNNISSWWGVRNNLVGTKSTTNKGNVSTWWEGIKKWWGEKKVGVGAKNDAKKSTVSGWWGTIKGWFGTHNFSIGTALSTTKSTVQGWASNIQTWWNNNKPKLGTSTWHLKFPVPTISWKEVTKFGITATLPSLGVTWKEFARGGFPDMSRYSLFTAGERGVPEMLGTVGGRTAVASGAEITGIRDAVNNASTAELAVLQTMVTLLNIIADKDFDVSIDGRSLVSAVDNRRARNGFSFT